MIIDNCSVWRHNFNNRHLNLLDQVLHFIDALTHVFRHHRLHLTLSPTPITLRVVFLRSRLLARRALCRTRDQNEVRIVLHQRLRLSQRPLALVVVLTTVAIEVAFSRAPFRLLFLLCVLAPAEVVFFHGAELAAGGRLGLQVLVVVHRHAAAVLLAIVVA